MSVATKPNNVHPTAVVSPRARIGNGCYIGPFSIVGDDVELKDGVRLESHVVIDGRTVIGQDTRVFPFRFDRPSRSGFEIQRRAFRNAHRPAQPD